MARAIAGGERAVRRASPISALLGTITPLGHDDGTLAAGLVFAQAGVPIGFVTMPQGGSTTPITMAGSLVVGIAEALSGVCAVQAAFPGAPVFVCFIPSVMDLRTGDFSGGAPEDTLMGAAVGNVGAFYGLPTQCGVNASAAKLPGWQSVIDDVTTTYLSLLAGVDMLAGVGMVAGGRIFSFEELVLGTEVTAAARAAARAAAVTSAAGAAGAARQVAGGLRAFGDDARAAARERAREILASHVPPPLEPGLDTELRRLVAGSRELGPRAGRDAGRRRGGPAGRRPRGLRRPRQGRGPDAGPAVHPILGHRPTGLAATIAARGVLVVGEDPEFAPQSSVGATGAWSGFDVDVAQQVATLLDVDVEIRELDWARVPAALKGAKYDVAISSIATDPAPASGLAFAAPYTYCAAQVAVRTGSTPITTLGRDSSGKTIGASASTTFQRFLEAASGVSVPLYTSDADALADVGNGSLAGAMTADTTAATMRPAARTSTVPAPASSTSRRPSPSARPRPTWSPCSTAPSGACAQRRARRPVAQVVPRPRRERAPGRRADVHKALAMLKAGTYPAQ